MLVSKPRSEDRFGLFRFRSPLLTESRLLSFPLLTEMFQFSRFALTALCIQAAVSRLLGMCCHIRKSQDHSSVTSSSGLIAGSYVLHRLSTPRHPPFALSDLIMPTRSRQAILDFGFAILDFSPASRFGNPPCWSISRRYVHAGVCMLRQPDLFEPLGNHSQDTTPPDRQPSQTFKRSRFSVLAAATRYGKTKTRVAATLTFHDLSKSDGNPLPTGRHPPLGGALRRIGLA